MKIFTIPAILLSLLSSAFSMEPDPKISQKTSQSPKMSDSQTMQRIDAFLKVLSTPDFATELEHAGKPGRTTRSVLLNYPDRFFQKYAYELIGGSLDETCGEFIINQIKQQSMKYGISYGGFYNLCLFTSFMMSKKTESLWADPILANVRSLIDYKTETNGSLPLFYKKIANKPEFIEFIENAPQDRFYPLILINNSHFAMKDYFYALSKRIHLLSLPFKSSTNLHGGYFQESVEVLLHDIAHLKQFQQFRKGRFPFSFAGDLTNPERAQKCDMYQRVGVYFFTLCQDQTIHLDDRKKLREIGFNLTHKIWSRGEVNLPVEATLQSDFRYLLDCLRINMKCEFLPDCLLNVETFTSSLADSYALHLQIKNPMSSVSAKDIMVEDEPKPYTYKVSFYDDKYDKKLYQSTICYEFLKRNRSDWVKSAQRMGYIGTVSLDNMDYNPTEAREYHLNMLDWFEKRFMG